MYIEIKKLSVNENWDLGIYSFSAELHVDGKLTAYVNRRQAGAMTDVDAVGREQEKDLDRLRDWIKELPPLYYASDMSGKKVIEQLDMDLEQYVDHLVRANQKIKDSVPYHRNMYEQMRCNLIVGNPEDLPYRILGYNSRDLHINIRLATPELREVFEKRIREEVVPSLKQTEYILNNNVPIEELLKLGVPRNKIFPAAVYHFRSVRQKQTLPDDPKKRSQRKK